MAFWRIIVTAAVVGFSIPAYAVSIPAVTLDQRGCCTGGGNNTVGWEFTVTTTVEVSALGVFDAWNSGGSSDGDGLLEEHQVGLWESDGTLIASVTVTPASISMELFVYQPLGAPLTLEPGVSYVIGAEFPSTLDARLNDGINGDTFVYDERIVPGAGRFRGPGFGFPDQAGGSRNIGPGFLLVPEPGTVALLSLALIGMLRRSRAAR